LADLVHTCENPYSFDRNDGCMFLLVNFIYYNYDVFKNFNIKYGINENDRVVDKIFKSIIL